jgi:hypothetical protein
MGGMDLDSATDRLRQVLEGGRPPERSVTDDDIDADLARAEAVLDRLEIRSWAEWDAAHKAPEGARHTNEEVRQKLGFHAMPEETRIKYTPISPFSIVRQQRNGVKGFNVQDMRTSRNIDVGSKREATHVAKMIEAHHYSEYSEPGSPRNDYVAIHSKSGRKAAVKANTTYEAQRKGAAAFGVKKPHEVSVMLAKKDGKQVTHVADF